MSLGLQGSNQSILKEIDPERSLEGLTLKLKLQYFGQLMQRADSLEKTLILGKIEGGRRRGRQRMRWLDGSHPYITTGKTIALARQTFVGKVMSLLFNTLSRFVIAFLSRSKGLLISWLQSLFAVNLEPKKV